MHRFRAEESSKKGFMFVVCLVGGAIDRFEAASSFCGPHLATGCFLSGNKCILKLITHILTKRESIKLFQSREHKFL